jgi:hypothetical protein
MRFVGGESCERAERERAQECGDEGLRHGSILRRPAEAEDAAENGAARENLSGLA